MSKAVLAAWLCIAALALLTWLLVAVTSLDPVVVGLIVSGGAIVPLYWVDRRRATARELSSTDDQST